jgi:uncharacterized protein YcfJ
MIGQMKTPLNSVALILVISAVATSAEAKGCLKGALVGGTAGHYVHHTVTGAIASCYMGHHIAREKQQQQITTPVQPREPNGGSDMDRK